jgi:hypothetical protein
VEDYGVRLETVAAPRSVTRYPAIEETIAIHATLISD